MSQNNLTAEPLNALPLAKQLQRRPDSNKAHSGKVLCIGGAIGMAGALLLTAKSALHSGAGYTMLCMLDSHSAHALAGQPELMIESAQVNNLADDPIAYLQRIQPNVIAIGPGLGSSLLAKAWLGAVLRDYAVVSSLGAIVFDADALNLIAADEALGAALQNCTLPCILTPHPGEAARLLHSSSADIQADRIASLNALVAWSKQIVILKGQHTLLGSPSEETRVCHRGNPSLAVGGTGDVLTGLIASLLAQGMDKKLTPWEAACLGVEVHALAADRLRDKLGGPIGMTPSELILEIRQVLNDLL
jgi:ADP-dependent NAD(P)H-hydrate dehydratase / NAD(P)H-hydrate epimerase